VTADPGPGPEHGTPPAWQRPAWLRAVRRVEQGLTTAALWVAMVGLALMSVFTCYQVVMRFIFDQPSTWSEVLVRSIMIWTVYLGAAAAFREGAMIAAEFFVRAVPRPFGKALQIFAGVLSLAFLAILVWTGIDMVGRTSTQVLAGLGIPISWVYLALPIGGALGTLAVLVRTSELLEPGAGIHESHSEPAL
jgi:TRAP-type C4-dicarboxylate transport system permease small subunit